jgi:hypothetical protein
MALTRKCQVRFRGQANPPCSFFFCTCQRLKAKAAGSSINWILPEGRCLFHSPLRRVWAETEKSGVTLTPWNQYVLEIISRSSYLVNSSLIDW